MQRPRSLEKDAADVLLQTYYHDFSSVKTSTILPRPTCTGWAILAVGKPEKLYLIHNLVLDNTVNSHSAIQIQLGTYLHSDRYTY
jgi:hypothetical protein